MNVFRGLVTTGATILFLSVGAVSMASAQGSQPLRLAPIIKKEPAADLTQPAPRQSGGDIANPRTRALSSRITGGGRRSR